MYSQLKDDEKARFRAWANMATARRISDARVQELDRRRPAIGRQERLPGPRTPVAVRTMRSSRRP